MTFILVFCICLSISFSQNDEEKHVKAVIVNMFDAMRENDSTKLRRAFAKDIISYSIFTNREGKVIRHKGNIEQFIGAVGKKKDKTWDERLTSWTILLDGDLASVWTGYEFYHGGQFSHCGVNSFQLSKESGEWKIIYIVDTRRHNNCKEKE